MSYGRGPCDGYGYGQPHSTANYHRTHSGDHVTKVTQKPCPAGGAVLKHHVVHKESFKEVDGGKQQAPANRRCFDNYPMKANHHGGGGSHHRYESYEETYEEESCEQETYAYGAGRHHGYGHGHGAGGGRRFEYETHEETYEEEEEEVVVGGGGCGQLRRGYRGA